MLEMRLRVVNITYSLENRLELELTETVFVGDIAEQARCKELIRSGAPLSPDDRDDLMFGPAPKTLAA